MLITWMLGYKKERSQGWLQDHGLNNWKDGVTIYWAGHVCIQVDQAGGGRSGVQCKKYQIWEICHNYKWKVDMNNQEINF